MEILAGIEDPRVNEVIEANYALAQAMQITGTPTFVMGRQLIRGFHARRRHGRSDRRGTRRAAVDGGATLLVDPKGPLVRPRPSTAETRCFSCKCSPPGARGMGNPSQKARAAQARASEGVAPSRGPKRTAPVPNRRNGSAGQTLSPPCGFAMQAWTGVYPKDHQPRRLGLAGSSGVSAAAYGRFQFRLGRHRRLWLRFRIWHRLSGGFDVRFGFKRGHFFCGSVLPWPPEHLWEHAGVSASVSAFVSGPRSGFLRRRRALRLFFGLPHSFGRGGFALRRRHGGLLGRCIHDFSRILSHLRLGTLNALCFGGLLAPAPAA